MLLIVTYVYGNLLTYDYRNRRKALGAINKIQAE